MIKDSFKNSRFIKRRVSREEYILGLAILAYGIIGFISEIVILIVKSVT